MKTGMKKDISERKSLEEGRKFLDEATKVLTSSLDYERTLDRLAHMLIPRFGDGCVIDLVENGHTIQRVSMVHSDSRKDKILKQFIQFTQYTPRHPIRKVLETGKSVFIPKVSKEFLRKIAINKGHLKLLTAIRPTSNLCVALSTRNKILGAITIVTTDKNKILTQEDIKLVEDLAQRASLAVDNARLYKEAQNEIRERGKVEKELRQAKEQFEIIFNNVADGITVQDSIGRLIYANEAAAFASGFSSPGAFVKASITEIFKRFELYDEEGNLFPLERLPSRRALRGEIDPQAVVMYKDLHTGETKWSMIKARPVFDEFGQVQIVINIFHDITERKVQEKKKDEFIGIASHELKTPITSIKAFTQILQKKFIDNHDFDSSSFLSKMNVQIDKLTELVNDLLDVTKISAGKLEYQKQIFTRFFRVSNVKKNKTSDGLGLGLHISSEIIKRHNGKIWVHSEAGKGSTFYFSLPVAQKEESVGRETSVA